MSEHERFTAFLRDAAAGYHEPPDTPREAMWREVEGALPATGDAAIEAEGRRPWIDGDDELAGAAASYHAPPATPHDDMWGRIEAAWELRRSAPPAAREAGLEALPERPLGADVANRPVDRRRALAAAGAVLAMAASLVIGIAIGRGSIGAFGGVDGAPRIAAADGAGATSGGAAAEDPLAAAEDPLASAEGPVASAEGPVASAEGPVASADTPQPTVEGRSVGLVPAPGTAGVSGAVETLESARPPETTLAAADRDTPDAAGARTPAAHDDAESAARTRSTRQVAIGFATARHLGHAETLLTSFRADSDADDGSAGSLEGTRALSEWARVLLADTRLLLDLPVERSETERALLEELELVLAQVARLGPGAPAFERDLIAESIEREGTIARLRAAAPPGAGATPTGT